MYSRMNSRAIVGMESHPVQIEVDVTRGIPAFEIVGLPDPAVRESRVRVKSAIRNSAFEFPNRRIHVNLAPADLKKGGSSYDLPIALAVLEATEQLRPVMPSAFVAIGELLLDGRLREVPGSLSVALSAKTGETSFIMVPEGNAREAALVEGVEVYGLSSLRDAVAFLEGGRPLRPVKVDAASLLRTEDGQCSDLSDVRGHESAKRALEVAAAGGHHMLMVGPPGSGKTMLARRLPGILAPMSLEEAVDVTRIHSVAGLICPGGSLVTERPFRDPHHSTSQAGLTGGGAPLPRPGEVTLAHNGVLYLDELALFSRRALESLRVPLEDRRVTIIRSMIPVTYPSKFTLVASMNPCPCGYLGDPRHECRCGAADIDRYRSKVSGPLLDRIDIQVEVPRLSRSQLQERAGGESSAAVRRRIESARLRQEERLRGSGVHCNADMDHRQVERFCRLDEKCERFMGMAVERLGLSARSYHRVLKTALTIADLASCRHIEVEHLAEAVQYRCLERPAFA